MSDAQRRAIRTALQAVSATLLIQLYNAAAGQFHFDPLNDAFTVALVPVLTIVLSFLQNWTEDNVEGVKAILKSPPSPGLEAMPEGRPTP